MQDPVVRPQAPTKGNLLNVVPCGTGLCIRARLHYRKIIIGTVSCFLNDAKYTKINMEAYSPNCIMN